MKKRMLKIIATVLSLVLVFMSVSLATSAEEAGKYPVVTIEGDNELGKITTNKSETIFLGEVWSYKGDYVPLMVSTDKITYKMVDLEKYLPEDTEEYVIVDYLVKDDLFAFVVFLYDVEVVFDDETQEYVEELFYLGTQIVTTTDFVSFKSNAFTINQDNPDVYWDLENYAELSDFGCVRDTFVYANTDFIVTRETETAVYVKGIYYSTIDFEKWEIHYTPELVLFDDTNVMNTDEFYSLKYDVVNSGVVIEHELLTVRDIGVSIGVVNDYSIEKTITTANFKDYKTIFEMTDKMRDCDCSYASVDKQPDVVFVIQSYTSYDDMDVHFTIASVNLKTGTAKTIFDGAYNEYLNYYTTSDAIYFSYCDQQTGSYLIKVDHTLECSTVLYTTSWSPYVGTVMSDKLYVGFGPTVYLFDDGSGSEYRFSKTLYDGYSFQKLIALENGVFALATNDANKDLVLIDGIKKTGDADFDNKVNSGDALKILQDATSLLTLSDEARAVADVDENGELNSNDALKVLQYSTVLILSLA